MQAVTHKITFRLNQDLRSAIKCSEAAFSDFIAATETKALEYSGYGKRYIMTKSFSPDAFLQGKRECVDCVVVWVFVCVFVCVCLCVYVCLCARACV